MNKNPKARTLSNRQMLFLSKEISANKLALSLATIGARKGKSQISKSVPPDLFTHFARNSFEQSAAWFYNQYAREALKACSDPDKAEFVFRYYYCAKYASIVIGWFTKQNKGMTPLWLFEPALYLIALERTHLEMVLSVTKSQINTYANSGWTKPIRVGDFAQLPSPSAEWFFNPPGGIKVWQTRFEAWHKAAQESFRYWVGTWCRDSITLHPALAKAAFLGALTNKIALPFGFTNELIQHLQKAHKDSLKMFFNNVAEPKDVFRGDPALDCWLIEIWPLVTKCKWNCAKISELARKRFDQKKKGGALDYQGIVARCEKLQLKLHPLLQKGGRPPKAASRKVSDKFELMAIWIASVGMVQNKWLEGQTGFVEF